MKFAIDQINNSTSLLPGVTLGYDMSDTCSEPLVALQPTLLFLTQNGTTGIGVLCNYTDYQPRVTAVIGPRSSDLCLVTAKLFSSFLIPQVKKVSGEARILFGGGRVWINTVYASGLRTRTVKAQSPVFPLPRFLGDLRQVIKLPSGTHLSVQPPGEQRGNAGSL